MKTVKIGFSRPKSPLKVFSFCIRLIEGWTPYSHVYVRSYSDVGEGDIIYQASGVQVNFMGLKHFVDHAEIVKEFEFQITLEEYKAYMKWAIQEAGAPYSVLQAFGILLVRLFKLKRNPFSNGCKAWVCSELVGKLLKDHFGANLPENQLDVAGPKYIYTICEDLYGKLQNGSAYNPS